MRQLPENFFGWNDHKSIMLTKFATLAAAMGCVVMVLCGPRIVSWVLAVHALHLGCSALPAGGCCAGAAVHLCHWRCGGVYGADRAGHQKCVCPGR